MGLKQKMAPLVLAAIVAMLGGIACDEDDGGASASGGAGGQAAAETECATGRACAPAPSTSEPSPESAPTSDPEGDFTRSRPLMGTVFQITVADTPADVAGPAVAAAMDEIARLEDVLSEWKPGSDISRINDAAGDHPVKVGDDALAVIHAGLSVSRWSHGAFDLSWAALRGLYDFNADEPTVPGRAAIRKRLPLIDWHRIQVDDEAKTVFLERKGMAIGTGGIGKGYALDRAGKVLRDAGIDSYMLFGGGQVQVHGMRGDRPWRVGIQHPRQDDYFAFLEATEGSISTSGDYEHYFFGPDGTRWHHILDPRTGLPARGALSVTVRAATGLYADALSTASFVLGAKRARAMFASMPYEAEMVMVDGKCQVVTTPGTDAHLHLKVKLGPNGELPNCKP